MLQSRLVLSLTWSETGFCVFYAIKLWSNVTLRPEFFYKLIYEPSYCNFRKVAKKNLIFFYPPTLILSLIFYYCGCPSYWGRQQVARVSNTQSPRLSVQWIYAAKAAHFHVSLITLRPGLFRSPSSSGARNRHTCDGVYE